MESDSESEQSFEVVVSKKRKHLTKISSKDKVPLFPREKEEQYFQDKWRTRYVVARRFVDFQ
jgi:hypothetical protein